MDGRDRTLATDVELASDQPAVVVLGLRVVGVRGREEAAEVGVLAFLIDAAAQLLAEQLQELALVVREAEPDAARRGRA